MKCRSFLKALFGSVVASKAVDFTKESVVLGFEMKTAFSDHDPVIDPKYSFEAESSNVFIGYRAGYNIPAGSLGYKPDAKFCTSSKHPE